MTFLSSTIARQLANEAIALVAMKTHWVKLSGLLIVVAALVAGCATSPSSAKISRGDAERAALARVPNGVIKEGELEKEHGRLIWSFDIATAGSKEITEVHVDAMTGEVIATEKESEAHEAAEKKEKKAK
jgi:uncharacterized membrane protein YkoI